MFTGIIENLGKLVKTERNGSNVELYIESTLTPELKVDQSVAHNGICLTVVEIYGDSTYRVTAIDETIKKTALRHWKEGDPVNLERCMQMNGRLDGHIVQGHVDQIGVCTKVSAEDGSWIFSFSYEPELGNVTVEKGSITVNGTSLTVVDSVPGGFSVAIIPYTYDNTVFHTVKEGTEVNLEFDIIGKYVSRHLQGYQ